MVAEYVYTLDTPDKFTFDNANSQNDVKVTDMVALDVDKLIIVERVNRHTKLYRIASLNSATNILSTMWDLTTANPSLENLSDLAVHSITPTNKRLVFDSRNELSDLSPKIEGLALLNDKYVVFTNDNDFGITDTKAKITVVKIAEQLKQ